ncbi:MAG: response regulator [Ignavibacteria bacterium]|nr:response regulator [Ignavibacteria bacterium]
MESKGLICIIEDNISIAKLFSTILKKGGFQTIEFNDAVTAIDWLKDNKPDCILTDILLPDINGTELLSKFRVHPHLSNVPVVAITGLAQPGDEENFISQGFDGYFSKPINIVSFVNDVEQIIAKKKEK